MRVATLTDGAKLVLAVERNGVWYDTRQSPQDALLSILSADLGSSEDYFREDRVVPGNYMTTLPYRPLRNVMCLGKNYLAHAEEFARFNDDAEVVPKAPIVFTKAVAALCGPNEEITVKASVAKELDYETELAVIIGRSGSSIEASKAKDYIAGYSVINDITARDLQALHAQWFLAKSLPSASPFGPVIVTPDELEPRGEKVLRTWVNGELRQEATLSEMIVGVEQAIETISRIVPLEEGDVIAMGTPSGVAVSFSPPKYLQNGDKIVSEIEGIGVLRNTVVIY